MELGLTLDTVRMLEQFFRHKVRDWQLAEDLAQETVLRAHEKQHLFDGREPKAWLFRLAKNILIDRSRKWKHDPIRNSVAADVCNPEKLDEELIEARDEAERVERAMFELPDDQRITLRLYQFGRSLPEIAVEMGCPLPTAKSRLRLAREKIRESLGV